MDWIKRWHTVKFIVLVYDGSRGVAAWVWINTLTLSHFLSLCHSLSLRTGDYIRSKITVNQFCSQCNGPVNYNHRLRLTRTDFHTDKMWPTFRHRATHRNTYMAFRASTVSYKEDCIHLSSVFTMWWFMKYEDATWRRWIWAEYQVYRMHTQYLPAGIQLVLSLVCWWQFIKMYHRMQH